MATINYAAREISVKIVYYGPGLSGKTTNLQVIHRRIPPDTKSDMVSLATETDRTLFFDFLPLDLGKIRGFSTKFQLYTVPGQVYYNATRKLVLRGVDGIVFVADSGANKITENLESFKNMEENLSEYGYNIESIPVVMQYNKRDLPNALPSLDLDSRINIFHFPWNEAVANKGQGVFESLKMIGKLVIDQLNQKYSSNVKKKPSSTPSKPAVEQQPVQQPAVQQPVQQQPPHLQQQPTYQQQQYQPQPQQSAPQQQSSPFLDTGIPKQPYMDQQYAANQQSFLNQPAANTPPNKYQPDLPMFGSAPSSQPQASQKPPQYEKNQTDFNTISLEPMNQAKSLDHSSPFVSDQPTDKPLPQYGDNDPASNPFAASGFQQPQDNFSQPQGFFQKPASPFQQPDTQPYQQFQQYGMTPEAPNPQKQNPMQQPYPEQGYPTMPPQYMQQQYPSMPPQQQPRPYSQPQPQQDQFQQPAYSDSAFSGSDHSFESANTTPEYGGVQQGYDQQQQFDSYQQQQYPDMQDAQGLDENGEAPDSSSQSSDGEVPLYFTSVDTDKVRKKGKKPINPKHAKKGTFLSRFFGKNQEE